MTQKERMLKGLLYRVDESLRPAFDRARELTSQINSCADQEERKCLFRELLGGTGENFLIESPFRCDYGKQIFVGENFYANYDCIILDQCPVRFGDNVLLGPRVSIFSAGHPTDAEIRNTGLEFGKPITVGNNVWIGGGAIINGGVTIGDNAVIGAGAVVTKDVPDNTIAVGNPARVLRQITKEEQMYWHELAEEWRKE